MPYSAADMLRQTYLAYTDVTEHDQFVQNHLASHACKCIAVDAIQGLAIDNCGMYSRRAEDGSSRVCKATSDCEYFPSLVGSWESAGAWDRAGS